jgi:hypothetical protein
MVRLESWIKSTSDAAGSLLGVGVSWDSLGSFSQSTKWVHLADRALLGCSLMEAGSGQTEVACLLHSDEAMVSLRPGAPTAAHLPLPPLPRAPPPLDEWPDSAAKARQAAAEAEARAKQPQLDFTPPALRPGEFTCAFPDQSTLMAAIDPSHLGLRLQYSLPAGLVASVSPDGTFAFRRAVPPRHSPDPDEACRLVLAGSSAAGAVATCLRDGRRKIFLPDGRLAVTDVQGNTVLTDRSGARSLVRPDGRVSSLSPVPCASQVDPETRARVSSRADLTLLIIYPNGASLSQFADGTRIHRDVGDEGDEGFQPPAPFSPAARRLQAWPTDQPLPRCRQLRVEAPGFPVVRIRAPDADADIVANPTRAQLWSAECRLPCGSSLRWCSAPGGAALELARVCGLRLLANVSGQLMLASRRLLARNPLPEPLTLRAEYPSDAVPPGVFVFDLGLTSIYQAARAAETEAAALLARKHQSTLEHHAHGAHGAGGHDTSHSVHVSARGASGSHEHSHSEHVQVSTSPVAAYPSPSLRVLDLEGNRIVSDLGGRVELVLARDSFNVVPESADGDYIPPQYVAVLFDQSPVFFERFI